MAGKLLILSEKSQRNNLRNFTFSEIDRCKIYNNTLSTRKGGRGGGLGEGRKKGYLCKGQYGQVPS